MPNLRHPWALEPILNVNWGEPPNALQPWTLTLDHSLRRQTWLHNAFVIWRRCERGQHKHI